MKSILSSIRPWRMSDADALTACINNRLVLDNLRDGIPYPYTKADAEAFISEMLAADTTQTFAFAITVEDMTVGSIAAFRCGNIHARTAELGYYLGEPYWGCGIATQAVCAVRDYIFETTNILRIFAEPFAYNTASCRVLEKAGFSFEGLLRKNAVKNGNILDMRMYACVKDC